MKKLLSLLFMGLLLSCTNSFYHVASVQSPQVKPIGQDFAFINEHLEVSYNLWEKGGRMRFMLYNKTDQPIYIDWSKSFLVRNDVKTFYSQLPTLRRKASADTAHYIYQNTHVMPYRESARSNRLTEIPPRTFVAIADFPLQQVVLQARTKEKVFTYTRENSPLRLEQQLTYSLDKALTTSHVMAHSFWVDQIQVMRVSEFSKLYGSSGKIQPNALYAVENRVATARAVVITGVITAAIVTGGIFIITDITESLF